MNDRSVWLVICEQGYANFYYVVGVYSTEEKANEVAEEGFDRHVEQYLIDRTTS